MRHGTSTAWRHAPWLGTVAFVAFAGFGSGCDAAIDSATGAPTSSAGDATAPSCTTCVVLADSQSNPHAIAADGTFVYWIDRGATSEQQSVGGAVMRTTLNGLITTVLDSDLTSPDNLAVDASSVYWSVQTQSGAAIMKVQKDGTGAAIIVSGVAAGGLFAIAGDDIYWTASIASSDPGSTGLTLFRSTTDGDGATPLAILQDDVGMAADESGAFVLDGSGLLHVHGDSGQVDIVTSGTGFTGTSHLLLDATSAYWMSTDEYESPGVFRVGKDGTGPRAIVPMTQGLTGVAIDQTFLYWTATATDDTDSLATGTATWRTPLSGGSATMMAETTSGPSDPQTAGFTGALAVDGFNVYATGTEMKPGDVTGLGEVLKIPK